MFRGVKIYTVHTRSGDFEHRQKPVFVKEGFNAMAFIFALFWAFYQRLWLPALAILACDIGLLFLSKAHWITHPSLIVLDIGLHTVVGFLANDWLRRKLRTRGYIQADISAADSLLRAQQRYFERALAT